MLNYISFFVGAIAGFLLDKIFDIIWKHVSNYLLKDIREKKIEKYYKTVSSKEYIDFQNEILKTYYGENCGINLWGEYYPIYALKGSMDVKYPFDSLNEYANLSREDKKLPFVKSRLYKKYRSIMEYGKSAIQHPKRQGYMLDEFVLDEANRITGLKAWVGTYDENIYTSHILEYEIYLLYKKYGRKILQKKDCISKKMLLRNAIHSGNTKEEVFNSGIARASLLGVQMLVIFKDKSNEYNVAVIKRSEKVASRPGFIQFVPSGGFDVFENSDSHDAKELRDNFSVEKALFREYVEELFGNEDFEHGKGGETVNKVINCKEVKYIKQMIDSEDAEFVFLGSVMDLTGLRHELSFALIIHDDSYSENTFISNHESKKIDRYKFDELNQIEEKQKINPSSAALWKLFIESDAYKNLLKKQ